MPGATEVPHALEVLLLLALRVLPGVWWLGFALRSAALSLALGLAAAVSLWPLALRIEPAAGSLGSQLWAAAAIELARGLTLGAGGLLPLFALRLAGRLSDAMRETQPLAPTESVLERFYSVAGAAVVFASGAHLIAWRALAGSVIDVPLGSSRADSAVFSAAARELALLLARAFELGVVLAAPVLLVVASGGLLVALTTRASLPFGRVLLAGPILPVLGLSAACLSISSILGEYPEVAQVFVESTRALLLGLR